MAPVSKPPAASRSSAASAASAANMDEDGLSGKVEDNSGGDPLDNSLETEFDAGQISILSKTIAPQPRHIYKAHWHIFAPTFFICIFYIACWVILYLMGKSGDSLARLFIVVLAVGVPILFAHAFLRYQTISIEIFENYLRYRTGWPKTEPVVIPYALIKKVNYTRGLSGRLFGGGTVTLQMAAGEVIGIADVEKTIEAKENIAAMIPKIPT